MFVQYNVSISQIDVVKFLGRVVYAKQQLINANSRLMKWCNKI